MLQSPAKRRKISPTQSVAGDATDADNTGRSNPTTPTRASYASPTKASLARSHPHILARSPGRRSQTASRGEILRQELLGQKGLQNVPRQESRTSIPQPHAPRHRDAVAGRDVSATAAPVTAENFSAAVARVFEAHEQVNTVPSLPLTDRQPPTRNDLQQPRASSINDLTAFIMPKLVQRPNATSTQPSRALFDELGLPPTPVQLGLDAAPERPRGLASSSSPGSSKSWSGKNDRRVRTSVATSSPLKPKDTAPPSRTTFQAKQKEVTEEEGVEEAPESEAEEELEQEDTVPEAIREKQTVLDDLQIQLKRLRADVAKLEQVVDTTDADTPARLDSRFISLLTTTNPSCAKISPNANSRPVSSTTLIAIQISDKPLPYLTLFAPGNLQLSTKTSSRTSKGRLQTIQILTLTAPPPLPPQIFSAVFEVITDAEDARIESVKLRQPRVGSWNAMQHKQLYSWIYSRLDDPLHKFDVGTLVWGLGRHFDECVKRAKLLRRLDCKFKKGDAGKIGNLDGQTALNSNQMKALIPYMASAQIEINANDTPDNSKRKRGRTGRNTTEPKILLSWIMKLDWTGEATSMIDITASGVPRKVQESVQEVFGTLSRRKGVVEAVGDVLGLLRGETEGP